MDAINADMVCKALWLTACLVWTVVLLINFFEPHKVGTWWKKYKYRVFPNEPVQGYKGFNHDMTCLDQQYKEGETYVFPDEPRLCARGFHFCPRLTDVFTYYGDTDNVYCRVEALGKIKGEENGQHDKLCTDVIRIGEKLTPKEIYDILLKENPGLPRSHAFIDSFCFTPLYNRRQHYTLNLVLKWKERSEKWLERQDVSSGDRPPGKSRKTVRINGRIRKRGKTRR